MVRQLVYISNLTATPERRESVLEDIAAVSARNNPGIGVTGAMFVSGPTVVQLLEGPAKAVSTLYATIETDNRHEQLRILHDELAPHADLLDWAMAVRDVTSSGETVLRLRDMVDAYEKSFKFQLGDFLEIVRSYLELESQ